MVLLFVIWQLTARQKMDVLSLAFDRESCARAEAAWKLICSRSASEIERIMHTYLVIGSRLDVRDP